jgi:hypothetical protein
MQTQEFQVTNVAMGGDPLPEQGKYLQITYQPTKGPRLVYEIAESNWVTWPPFATDKAVSVAPD